MKISVEAFGRNVCIVAFTIIFVCFLGCRSAQTQITVAPKVETSQTAKPQKTGEIGEWIPGNYEEIEIGKSTRKDVIEKFGKPVWEGEEQIEAEEEDVQKEIKSHGGKRLMLEHRDIEIFDGGITVLYGERDKIVRAISLNPKEPLSKEVIIKKYGNSFIELGSNDNACSAIDSTREKDSAKKNEMPSKLVYPQLGMFISLSGNSQKVDRIDYLLTCQE